MQAVAAVTHNRTLHKNYPSDVCKVIFQPKQFSWVEKIDYKFIIKIMNGEITELSEKDKFKYKIANDIAKMSSEDLNSKIKGFPIYYHNIKVKPKWAENKRIVTKIDNHVFYK